MFGAVQPAYIIPESIHGKKTGAAVCAVNLRASGAARTGPPLQSLPKHGFGLGLAPSGCL